MKIGDWVKINVGLPSPCYTITKIYKNENGIVCADGVGRAGAKMENFPLYKLKLVERRI